MQAVFGELARVVKQHGTVVIVVGNSFLSGAVVDNSMLVRGHCSGIRIPGSGLKGKVNFGSTPLFAATPEWKTTCWTLE